MLILIKNLNFKFCFKKVYFEFEQTNRICDYIIDRYNSRPEYLWKTTPNFGVFRNKDNLKWFDKWQKEFNEPNLDIRWRDEGEIYEQAAFEDEIKYDVIVVDGKRRFQCAEAAVKALNKGGMIILDDSDRINTSQEYVKAVDILKKADLLQVDFYGFCPMNNYTKTTSVFFSRDFNFESLYKVQPINGWGNLWSKSRKDRKEFYKKSM